MTAPRPHDDALRLDLIRVTADLLVSRGPAAVSLREIAAACNTSTTAIYSLFGGKAQIIKAVAAEGFADLAISLSSIDPQDTPHATLLALAHTYRDWALANPALFAAMYSQPQPSLTPGTPARANQDGAMEELVQSSIASAFQPLREAARRAAHDSTAEPEAIVHAVWAMTHGWITLELGGALKSSRFESYASAAIRSAIE